MKPRKNEEFMKVLFINNYEMDIAWEMWKKKEHPGQHLWGVTHLAPYNIDVEILPHTKYVFLKKLSRLLKLGDLDQQVRILLRRSDYDLVYSGCQFNTLLLALLRYFGIFRKPIVAIMHRPFRGGLENKTFAKLYVGGHDQLLCLTSSIIDQLRNEFGMVQECKTKVDSLEWGVDLPFYEFEEFKIEKLTPESIFSAGKTHRDYDTLIKAFREINYPLRIYTSKETPTIPELPSNVKLLFSRLNTNRKLFFEEHEKAYAIAIPLKLSSTGADSGLPIGWTSLLEAMVMGKAVVMTRNPKVQVDLDIEKEGFGLWVEPGDVNGWQQAIRYLLDHPHETQEMGKKARYLCEAKYNMDVFSSKLAKHLKSAMLVPANHLT
jgi:glycosyltransferase involved in cell wall biosynthesis